MRKINAFFRRYYDIGPFVIRLMVGFHLIHSVYSIIFTKGSMSGVVEFFKSQHIIVPEFIAPFVAYAELIGGALYILGLWTRITAFILVIIFICAISIVHIGDTYSNTFPEIVMFVGSLYLLFCGPGKISLDHMIAKNGEAIR
ncbi:MAG: DoxX family protein [Saprospiraceae bacterium]